MNKWKFKIKISSVLFKFVSTKELISSTVSTVMSISTPKILVKKLIKAKICKFCTENNTFYILKM
jgi:hypothetical protein